MPELTAADLAEGRRLMKALANPATGSVADAEMAMWLFTNLPALVDAAEKVGRIQLVLASLPYSVINCGSYPDDDPVVCGWKRTVADIQRVLEANTGE